MRRYLWLATDQNYKAAVDSLARKRAALNNVAARDPIADFARAEPVQVIDELPAGKLDHEAWQARVRALSAIFVEFPLVDAPTWSCRRLKTSAIWSIPRGQRCGREDVMFLRVRAVGQAPDGMHVRDAESFHTLGFQHARRRGTGS